MVIKAQHFIRLLCLRTSKDLHLKSIILQLTQHRLLLLHSLNTHLRFITSILELILTFSAFTLTLNLLKIISLALVAPLYSKVSFWATIFSLEFTLFLMVPILVELEERELKEAFPFILLLYSMEEVKFLKELEGNILFILFTTPCFHSQNSAKHKEVIDFIQQVAQ